MSVSALLGNPKPQFFVSGLPAVGYRLFFYAAETSTKQNTFTDSTATIANSNPIVLDAEGYPTGNVMIYGTDNVGYKVIMAPPGTDDPPTSPTWTIDKIFTTASGLIQIGTTVVNFTTTAGQTLFSLPPNVSYGTGNNSLQVFLGNGASGGRLRLTKDQDYTETSTTSFTLTYGTIANDRITVVIGQTLASPSTVAASSVILSSGDNAQDYISAISTNNLITAKGLTAGIADSIYITGRVTKGDGYEGRFYWNSSDLTTEVITDTQNAIYIPPNSDVTGASGAWVRLHKTGYLHVAWFNFKESNSNASNYTAWSAISDYCRADDSIIWTVELEHAKSYTMDGAVGGFTDGLFHNVRGLIINGNGSTITNIAGNDDFILCRQQIFSDGTNQVGFAGYLISSASSDDISVVCSTASDAANFTVDRWALVHGYIQQGGNDVPPNLRYFQYLKVRSTNVGTGEVTFYSPIRFTYNTSWRDDENTNPTPSEYYGKPRIIPLYRTDFKIKEQLEINDLTIGGGSKAGFTSSAFSPSGTLFFKAEKFNLESANMAFSQMAFSTCTNCLWNGPYDPTLPTNNNDTSITIDKICETITLNDCMCPRGLRDGSGVHQFTMNGGLLGTNEDQGINLGAARFSQFNNVDFELRSDRTGVFDMAAFFIESMQINGGRLIGSGITGGSKYHFTSDGSLNFTPFDAPSNTQLRFLPTGGNNGLLDNRLGIGSYIYDPTGGDWAFIENITWDGTYHVVDVKPSAAGISGSNDWYAHYRNGVVVKDLAYEGGDIGMLAQNRSFSEITPLGQCIKRYSLYINSTQLDLTDARPSWFSDGMYILEVRAHVAVAYTGSSTVAKFNVGAFTTGGNLNIDLKTTGTRWANETASSLLGTDATAAGNFGLKGQIFYCNFQSDAGVNNVLPGTWDQMPIFDVEIIFIKPPVPSGA